MALEVCSKCKKSFKSLLQHYKKSACGASSQNRTSSLPRTRNNCSSVDVQEPSVDFDYADNDIDGFVDNDITDNVIEPIYYPPGVYHIPVSQINHRHTHSPQQLGYVKLIQFLSEHNAPKYAFDDLMDMFIELSKSRFDFGAQHPKRKSVMNNVRKKFAHTRYECIPLQLEKDAESTQTGDKLRDSPELVNVYRFDIEQQLRDLIASEIFYDESNLVINKQNPFGKYIPEDNRYDEIHSGDWYNRTYERFQNSDTNDFMLALKLYCDKTGCDPMLQRHGLEPIMFTFTIFKRSVQQQCETAWRHIGFLPDLDKRSKAESKHNSGNDIRRGRTTRNYHRCLKKLLEPLIKIQREGLTVSLRIGNNVRSVRAFFPIAMIIGDAKSNDLWCCRVSHNEQVRMSRACYTPFEKCSDFNHVCKMVSQKEQWKLAERCTVTDEEIDHKLLDDLRKTSTVRCAPCIFQLDFGSSVHGQFLACTADPMHLFEGGWCAHVCKAFVKPLSSAMMLELDLWLEKILHQTRSTVRSRFPRCNFSGGITSMTNIASHEWPGIILAYLIAIRTQYGQHILTNRLDDNDKTYHHRITREAKRQKVEDDRNELLEQHDLLTRMEKISYNKKKTRNSKCNSSSAVSHGDDDQDDSSDADESKLQGHSRCTLENIVQLFEMMLCFHAFYKKASYWTVGNQRQAKEFDSALRRMMEQLVNTLDRGTKTKGWNMQKIHELLHFPLQVKEFGNLMNSDAGVGERGLKLWAKKPARLALKGDVDVFTESTTKQVIDSVLLNTAIEYMENGRDRNVRSAADACTQHITGMKGKPKYRIHHAEGDMRTINCHWLSDHDYKGSVELPDQIFDLFVEEYYGEDGISMESLHIDGFTELRLNNGDLIRAHPNFRSQGEFYDWVIIKDPNDGIDHATLGLKKIPEMEKPAETLSRIGKEYANHVPARVLALFRHPVTRVDMAIVHPCRPWTKRNEQDSSVIIERWNLQCSHKIYYTRKDSDVLHEQYFPGCKEVMRYVPMYHVVDVSTMKNSIFAIQEDPLFDELWTINQGGVLVVADRDHYWADEFVDFK